MLDFVPVLIGGCLDRVQHFTFISGTSAGFYMSLCVWGGVLWCSACARGRAHVHTF